jgi:hypothetical protein
MTQSYDDFFKKQLPLCGDSPFTNTLNQLSHKKRYELIDKSYDEFNADLVSGKCPRMHLCRGGNMCFGRPLPDYKELQDDISRIPNVQKGKFLGKDCLVVYPTFCTTFDQFGGKSMCQFASTCTTQCATMSSRLEVEDSMDSVGDESTLEFMDSIDYSEMGYEHVAKPLEKQKDICWYGISDRSKKIVELYDLWAYDFDEIAVELDGDVRNKGNIVNSYHSTIKKLQRNARITKALPKLKRFSYKQLAKHSGESNTTVTRLVRWAWDNSESFRLMLLGLSGDLGRPDAPNPFEVNLDGVGEAHTDPTGNAE